MKRYKDRIVEESPEWMDKKVSELLEVLRDNNFSNDDSRKHFVDIISTLHNSKDKRARKAFKHMGDLFSDIADELIKYGNIEESVLKEDENDKSKDAIKDLIDTKWSGSNEEQGKAVALLKGLAFSDTEVSNKFMKKVDSLMSSLKSEDYK